MVLEEAIESIIDREAFDHELKQEKSDAMEIGKVRHRVVAAIQGQ